MRTCFASGRSLGHDRVVIDVLHLSHDRGWIVDHSRLQFDGRNATGSDKPHVVLKVYLPTGGGDRYATEAVTG